LRLVSTYPDLRESESASSSLPIELAVDSGIMLATKENGSSVLSD